MERKTILSRGGNTPVAEGVNVGVPQGAFGDYRGLINAGQDISNSADMIGQRLKAAQDRSDNLAGRRLAQEYAVESYRSRVGVYETFKKAREENAIPENTREWIDQLINDAQNKHSERTNELARNPLFSRFVGPEDTDKPWLELRHNLTVEGISYDAQRNNGRTMDNFQEMVTAVSMLPGGLDEMKANADDISRKVSDSNLTFAQKDAVQRSLGGAVYASVIRDIEVNGMGVNQTTIDNLPYLDQQQKRAIATSNARLLAGPEMTLTDANRVARETSAALVEGRQVRVPTTVINKAREIAKSQNDGGASLRAFDNQINAAQLIGIAVDRLDNVQSTYAEVMETARALSSDTDMRKYFAQIAGSDFLAEMPSDLTDNLRNAALVRANQKAELYRNSRGNEAFDGLPQIQPLSNDFYSVFKAALNEAAMDPNSPKAHQAVTDMHQRFMAYKKKVDEVYDIKGVPKDKRGYVPTAVASLVDSAVASGQGNMASAAIYNMRVATGSEGAMSYIRHYLKDTAKDQSRTSPIAGWMLHHVLGMSDKPDGSVEFTTFATAKETYDAVFNSEKNEKQWSIANSKWAQMADEAFNYTSFNMPASVKTIAEGSRLTDVKFPAQSYQGLYSAIRLDMGLDMATAFKSYVRNAVAHRALGTESAGQVDDFGLAGSISRASRDMLHNISQTVAVVKSGAGGDDFETGAYYTMVPKSLMTAEGFMEMPKEFGFSDVRDLSDSMGRVFDAMYYHSKSKMDRRGIGNLLDFGQVMWDNLIEQTPLSSFGSLPLNESFKLFPKALEIDFSKVALKPDYAGASDKTYEKLTNPISWGAGDDKYTANALTFAQHGRYVIEGDKIYLRVQSAPQKSADDDSVPSTAWTNLRYENGEPVTIPLRDFVLYNYQFREARIKKLGGYMFKRGFIPDSKLQFSPSK